MVNGKDPFLQIRQASYLPIIVLGGREELADMLEREADAYLIKSPSLGELVARVPSLLRRKPRYDPPGDDHGLDIENHLDNGGNGSNGLTPTEFRLASCLVLNKGRLLEYSRLIGEVWGGREVSRCTLHFYIRRLQRKLQAYSLYRVNIRNFRGVGYCLSGDGGAVVYDDSTMVLVKAPVDYVESLQGNDAEIEELL